MRKTADIVESKAYIKKIMGVLPPTFVVAG
jgi:hypothetical protein